MGIGTIVLLLVLTIYPSAAMRYFDQLLFALPFVHSFAVASSICSPSISHCRYSPEYSQSDVLSNPDRFACEVFYWEGRFHQNGVGFNTANGMTYDGSYLNPKTGFATSRHNFSAASKEVLPSTFLHSC
jgi:hypothetical protein